MSGKGNSRYMKRLNAPEYFGVHRKEHAYITKPNAGRHNLQRSVALSLASRKLGVVGNTQESIKTIKSGTFKINGRVIKEPKYPVGLGDIIETGGEHFRIWINKQGKIEFEKGKHTEPLYKVVRKYKDSGNKIMLQLSDGTVLHAKADVGINDSVMLKEGKITKTFKFQPGAHCAVVDGVHVGSVGKIVNVVEGTMHKPKSLVIEADSQKFETLVRNILVTG